MTGGDIARLGWIIGNEILNGVEKAQAEGIACEPPSEFTVTIFGEEHAFVLDKCSNRAISAEAAFTSVYEKHKAEAP